MAKLLGTDLTVTFSDEVAHHPITVAGSTSCSLDLGTNMIDATTKDDDAEWESQQPASKNWSISWDGLIVDDGADQIIEAIVKSTLVTCTFVIGSSTYKGTGYITSSNFSGAVKDLAKANFSVTGAGKMQKQTATTQTTTTGSN